eukprot:g2139.t1
MIQNEKVGGDVYSNEMDVNLSNRSFSAFASSTRNLINLSDHIYDENILNPVKFHLNHDDDLIKLVNTVGWWLRNHVDDDETDVEWELALSSSNTSVDGLHLRNGWKILSNGLTHEEPLVRLHSIYAIIEGSRTLELEEEYNQAFVMRENKRTGFFQSHEARFDDHIISISYAKNYLLPGEKLEMNIYIYVVEHAKIDTNIFIKLNNGGVSWKVRILAKGNPPTVSHDILFLLQDLDDIDRMLRPVEVGRDVHFDAILAQPDKILNISLGHLLKPITPDIRRQGISYLTSMPVPATRFVVDPRTKRWYTDRKPLQFGKSNNTSDNDKWGLE